MIELIGVTMKEIKKTDRTVSRYFELDNSDIFEYLLSKNKDIPANAAFFVHVDVPGGGDWSNTELKVDAETPVKLHVTYQEKG